MDGSRTGTALVGRQAELERLDDLVGRLERGCGDVVVITGEAGIGKSTLARHAIGEARRAGVRHALVAATQIGIEQPLHIAELMVGTLGITGAQNQHRGLIEAVLADPITLTTKQMVDAIDDAAAREPVLLVVEDVQWADLASLLALQHLAQRPTTKLGIIVTSRTMVEGTPRAQLVAQLPGDRIDLRGLDAASVDALLSTALGHIDESLQLEIDRADGNPMILSALIDDARRGTTGADAGNGPIERMVGSLPDDVIEVVRIAALMERPFDIAVVSAVLQVPPHHVIARLDQACRANVLRVVDGDYDFRHDLYREAVIAAVSDAARPVLHRAISEALSDLGAPGLVVAGHLVLGARPGDSDAIEQLTDIAESLVASRPSAALEIVESARAVSDGGVPTRLQLVKVAALAACGRVSDADRLGTALLATSLEPLAEGGLRRDLALAAFVDGRADDAAAHMERAIELAATPHAGAKGRTELAWAQFLALDLDKAHIGAEHGIVHGDLGTQIAAHSLRGWLSLWRCDAERARTTAVELDGLVEIAPSGDWHVFCPLLTVAALHLELGDHAASRTVAQRGRAQAVSAGASWAAAAYDAMIAAADLRVGDLTAAHLAAQRAVDGTAIVDGFGVELWSRAMLATLSLLRGDRDAAADHIEAAQVAAADGRAQLGIDHLALATAAWYRLDGDHDRAVKELNDAWSLLDMAGIGHVSTRVGSTLVAELVASGSMAHARSVGERVVEHCGRTRFTGLRAEGARVHALLDPTPESFRRALEIGRAHPDALRDLDTLERAVALLPRSARRPFAGELRSKRAELGLRPNSAPSGLFERRPVSGLDSLTPAEQRVARLLTDGLTNSEIGRELFVSRRTVDSHVLSCFRKCGVSTRVALTRLILADQAPPTPGSPR